MLESKIQSKIINKLTKEGFFVVKLGITNKPGIPDLLCLKDGVYKWIEVKAEDGRLSELQKHRIRELERHGASVEILKS